MNTRKILIIGANGQIGTVLTAALRLQFGANHVLATDIRPPEQDTGPFELLDVTDPDGIAHCLNTHQPDHIYHLAALLSAKGEQNPSLTWKINFDGLMNVLHAAKDHDVKRVFYPSTIAVFGPTTPRVQTPQESPLVPTTVYGISKVSGELWSRYFFERYGLDVRSLRYPGIIGHQSIPEGGTTDYAVEIFHHALQHGHYECFLGPDTRLPMMYMDDAVKATIALMEAPPESINVRYSYNLNGMDFTPAEIAEAIQQKIPDFTISYKPDFRQDIAESWPQSIDDTKARTDWGWAPEYDLNRMVEVMIENISTQYS